jgi:hypothetical protein
MSQKTQTNTHSDGVRGTPNRLVSSTIDLISIPKDSLVLGAKLKICTACADARGLGFWLSRGSILVPICRKKTPGLVDCAKTNNIWQKRTKRTILHLRSAEKAVSSSTALAIVKQECSPTAQGFWTEGSP